MFKRFIAWLNRVSSPPVPRHNSEAWPTDLSDEREMADELDAAGEMDELDPRHARQGFPPPNRAPVITGQEVTRLLADIGVGLWRLRSKMVEPGTTRPLAEMERVYRHVESLWDVMEQAGLQIRDHTDEPVPEGGIYSLHAIAYQPTAGITREKVLETLKPSIFYKSHLIQMGEVIIATPDLRRDPD
jgi:hypothetical protein